MKLMVTFPDGKDWEIEGVNPSTSVNALKGDVLLRKNQYQVFIEDESELEKIWIEEVVLHFGGAKLEDGRTLGSYGLGDNSKLSFSILPLPYLHLSLCDNGHYTRKCKFIPGKTTFGDLRKELFDAHTKEREFFYQGEKLDDSQIIDDSYRDKKLEMKEKGAVKEIGVVKEVGKDRYYNLTRYALLSFLGLMFLSSSSVACAGWKHRGEASSISPDRAKAGALISMLTAGMAICLVSYQGYVGHDRS